MKMCHTLLGVFLKQLFLERLFLQHSFILLLLISNARDVSSMEDSVRAVSDNHEGLPTHSEEYLKKLFVRTRNLVLNNSVSLETVTPTLCLACVFHGFNESRELFKCVAGYEPLSLSLLHYNNVTSVFHFIVAMVNYYAKKDPLFYEHFVEEGGLSFISWLADESVKDEIVSEGKTASEKAAELGLCKVAEHIVSALSLAKAQIT